MRTLRVATYNIHRCVGTDGLYRPSRIVEVIRELDADVVGLQEIDTHAATESGHQLNYIIKHTPYHVVAGPTIFRDEAHYGNALLTRHEIHTIRQLNLSVTGFEPRGALGVDVKINGEIYKMVNLHLGLKRSERFTQLRALLDDLKVVDGNRIILMGDFNEWVPFRGATRLLYGQFRRRGLRGSFPSPLPVLRLDEIYAHPKNLLRRAWVHSSELARVASDHLPVIAEIRVDDSVSLQ